MSGQRRIGYQDGGAVDMLPPSIPPLTGYGMGSGATDAAVPALPASPVASPSPGGRRRGGRGGGASGSSDSGTDPYVIPAKIGRFGIEKKAARYKVPGQPTILMDPQGYADGGVVEEDDVVSASGAKQKRRGGRRVKMRIGGQRSQGGDEQEPYDTDFLQPWTATGYPSPSDYPSGYAAGGPVEEADREDDDIYAGTAPKWSPEQEKALLETAETEGVGYARGGMVRGYDDGGWVQAPSTPAMFESSNRQMNAITARQQPELTPGTSGVYQDPDSPDTTQSDGTRARARPGRSSLPRAPAIAQQRRPRATPLRPPPTRYLPPARQQTASLEDIGYRDVSQGYADGGEVEEDQYALDPVDMRYAQPARHVLDDSGSRSEERDATPVEQDDQERRSDIRAFKGISGMASPKRFQGAVRDMPLSENIEDRRDRPEGLVDRQPGVGYAEPAFGDRARSALGQVLDYTRRQFGLHRIGQPRTGYAEGGEVTDDEQPQYIPLADDSDVASPIPLADDSERARLIDAPAPGRTGFREQLGNLIGMRGREGQQQAYDEGQKGWRDTLSALSPDEAQPPVSPVQRIRDYLSGKGGHSPEDMQSFYRDAEAKNPGLSHNDLTQHIFDNFMSRNDFDGASRTVQSLRQPYDQVRAVGQAALAQGNTEAAVRAFNHAHDLLPNNTQLSLTADPTGGSVQALVMGPDRSTHKFDLTPKQFWDYAMGPASQLDHVVDNTTAGNFRKVIRPSGAATAEEANAAGYPLAKGEMMRKQDLEPIEPGGRARGGVPWYERRDESNIPRDPHAGYLQQTNADADRRTAETERLDKQADADYFQRGLTPPSLRGLDKQSDALEDRRRIFEQDLEFEQQRGNLGLGSQRPSGTPRAAPSRSRAAPSRQRRSPGRQRRSDVEDDGLTSYASAGGGATVEIPPPVDAPMGSRWFRTPDNRVIPMEDILRGGVESTPQSAPTRSRPGGMTDDVAAGGEQALPRNQYAQAQTGTMTDAGPETAPLAALGRGVFAPGSVGQATDIRTRPVDLGQPSGPLGDQTFAPGTVGPFTAAKTAPARSMMTPEARAAEERSSRELAATPQPPPAPPQPPAPYVEWEERHDPKTGRLTAKIPHLINPGGRTTGDPAAVQQRAETAAMQSLDHQTQQLMLNYRKKMELDPKSITPTEQRAYDLFNARVEQQLGAQPRTAPQGRPAQQQGSQPAARAPGTYAPPPGKQWIHNPNTGEIRLWPP